MSPQLQRIEEDALLLPAEDRELLIERLLRSLQGSTPSRSTAESQAGAPYRIKPFASGKCLLDDLSSTAQVLAWAEGEDFR